MLKSFHEAWVYYQPKDLVGGDFYWMKEIQNAEEHIVYFALADCTGVLAAQVIKPQARVLAEARGIGCVEIDLGVVRGEREPDLTLFAA